MNNHKKQALLKIKRCRQEIKKFDEMRKDNVRLQECLIQMTAAMLSNMDAIEAFLNHITEADDK